MNNSTITLRLARDLRKGNHKKSAVQKALARIRNGARSAQHQLPPEDDTNGREEPHGQVDDSQASLPHIGMRYEGEGS